MFLVHIHLFIFVIPVRLASFIQFPFNDCEIKAVHLLQLVYSDLWGPAPHISAEG